MCTLPPQMMNLSITNHHYDTFPLNILSVDYQWTGAKFAKCIAKISGLYKLCVWFGFRVSNICFRTSDWVAWCSKRATVCRSTRWTVRSERFMTACAYIGMATISPQPPANETGGKWKVHWAVRIIAKWFIKPAPRVVENVRPGRGGGRRRAFVVWMTSLLSAITAIRFCTVTWFKF
jgi:hypothetical protein